MNIKKYFYSPFFYLVLAIVGYFGFTQIADVDFGFHLAQGKYFFENNWRLPIKEVYSYPIAGQTNIILSWLFDVGIYFSYLKLGFFGISSWKALALAALALLFILRLEKLTAARNIKITEWFAYGAAFMFLAGVYLWANIERPHALGYLYFSLFLLFIDDFLNSPQKWHWIFFAVLQIFWTNTHTSFTVSLIVLTIFIAGLYWKLLENKKYPKTCREEELSKIRGQIKSLIQLLILLAVVSMINPYGPAIFPNFFLKASPPVVYRFIQELWPMHMVELWSVKGVLWFLSIFPIINF